MNMSLHPIAEAVRSQGRNGDSMLVHMTPGEVAALQRMAEANGGTLTINPETGQPEAFFLASLLPTIAGALAPSLAGAGGIMGTLFGTPLMSSLTIGGITGLLTGDMEQGLMAGLGAYGGYGLGQSLMGAGAATAAPSVTPAASAAPQANAAIGAAGRPPIPGLQGAPAVMPKAAIPAMPDASTLNQMGGFATHGGLGDLSSGLVDPTQLALGDREGALAEAARLYQTDPGGFYKATQGLPTHAYGQVSRAALGGPKTTLAPELYGGKATVQTLEQALAAGDPSGFATQSPMQAALSQAGASVGEMGTGIQNVLAGKTPGGAMGFLKDNAMDIGMAAAPMVSAALKKDDKEEEVKKDTEQYYYPGMTLGRATPEQVAAQRASFGAPEAGLPYSTREVTYFPGFSYGERKTRNVAGGGLMDMADGGVASYKAGGLKKDSFIIPADVLAALGNGSNNAGLAALNKMLAKVGAPRAEKIDGPGDGMSDSIPTSIEGKQPARVAKDEAYVPTEAVRRLGGGDVKKGAKKLYNLMARVRKAAHGDDKQQRKVNPDRLARA